MGIIAKQLVTSIYETVITFAKMKLGRNKSLWEDHACNAILVSRQELKTFFCKFQFLAFWQVCACCYFCCCWCCCCFARLILTYFGAKHFRTFVSVCKNSNRKQIRTKMRYNFSHQASMHVSNKQSSTLFVFFFQCNIYFSFVCQ